MAYKIFTFKKLMLTNKMNSTNLQMMKIQFKRDEIEDKLLSLWSKYSGFDVQNETPDGIDVNDTRTGAGISTFQDVSDTNKEKIEADIERYQIQENKLDQLLKKYETEYSEAQTELKSVETQEAQALQASVPKYGGITQQG